MFSLQQYIVTNPKGEVEYLNGTEYISRMLKLASVVKSNGSSFTKWAESRKIPVPVRKEDDLVSISSDHLKAYLIDSGYKFEEI